MFKAKDGIPRFGISLFMLDETGKVILNKSGGNNNIHEVVDVKNFKLLSKVFRKAVQEWYRDEAANSPEARKKAWTEEDQKAADERKAKLAELQGGQND